MTTNDTTGDKLVESIRRTKIAAGAPVADTAVPATRPAASVSSTAGPASSTAAPAAPPQRRRATTVRSAKPAATSAAPLAPPAVRDRYRSVGRVWPD